MTPQERQLVAELFDRLAHLETARRDPDAQRAIEQGLQAAPNALYPLVQTVLVQDEALKRANARIEELEAELGSEPEQPQGGGFLDSMRNKLTGRQDAARGSVPTVRSGEQPMGAPDPRWNNPNSRWNTGQAQGQPEPSPPATGGGSFLGTAASAAAGAIGGALLLNGIRSMFGQSGSAHAGFDPGLSGGDRSNPWSGGSGGDLARQAGVDDIGRAPATSGAGSEATGLFGGDDDDTYDDDVDADDSDADDTENSEE